jgi:hypothetical protein
LIRIEIDNRWNIREIDVSIIEEIDFNDIKSLNKDEIEISNNHIVCRKIDVSSVSSIEEIDLSDIKDLSRDEIEVNNDCVVCRVRVVVSTCWRRLFVIFDTYFVFLY